MKWEPVLAMAAVLALGVWLVMGPGGANSGLPELRPGARTVELRLAREKGALEIYEAPDGERSYRVLMRGAPPGPAVDAEEFDALLPPGFAQRLAPHDSSWLFSLFNISSWASFAWIAVGFGGQIVFSGRFLIQWLVSEKKRQSVVPEAFWWMSLLGGVLLFAYFVWRRDVVGVVGQSSGLVIYARNIRLIHKRKARDRRRALKAELASAVEPSLEEPLQAPLSPSMSELDPDPPAAPDRPA
ncbi:MAG: lipid-A-disaccharide synthase N-terminal domain-containing protein [Planctomycetota bacterium]|nr:lipid-A-disaccharide synthase N-terminal domain-containing protein [Planctomycetota bacterium]